MPRLHCVRPRCQVSGDHLQHPGHRKEDEPHGCGAEEQVVTTLAPDQESGRVARRQKQVPAHERHEEEAEPHPPVSLAGERGLRSGFRGRARRFHRPGNLQLVRDLGNDLLNSLTPKQLRTIHRMAGLGVVNGPGRLGLLVRVFPHQRLRVTGGRLARGAEWPPGSKRIIGGPLGRYHGRMGQIPGTQPCQDPFRPPPPAIAKYTSPYQLTTPVVISASFSRSAAPNDYAAASTRTSSV